MCTAREYYKALCDLSRKQLEQTFHGVLPSTIQVAPCGHDLMLHLSFDFVQQVKTYYTSLSIITHLQVHYPSNPLQPGPIYFLTPRKCGIFGVCCEGIPLQLNYLIDESVDCGKGANTVVSLLHDFLSTCPALLKQACYLRRAC